MVSLKIERQVVLQSLMHSKMNATLYARNNDLYEAEFVCEKYHKNDECKYNFRVRFEQKLDRRSARLAPERVYILRTDGNG